MGGDKQTVIHTDGENGGQRTEQRGCFSEGGGVGGGGGATAS